MKSHLRKLAPVLVSLFFVTAGAPWLNSQIDHEMRAHVDHSFMIGNTTLPLVTILSGRYKTRIFQR